MPWHHRSFVSTATGITLVAATSLIGYVLYRRRRSLSSARTRVDGDLSTILADRDQSEMEKPKPVQCDIPVVSGLKTFVACAKGKDENTILGGWVPAMRKAGSVVVMTPLSDVTSLRKVPDGVFDLVVVEDGEDVDVDILNGILEQLKPDCKVQVVFHRDAPSPANKRALMFAGFVEVAVSTKNERVLVGERPKWICGASAPFRRPIRKPENNSSAAAAVTLPVKGVSAVANGDSSTPPAEKKTWKLVMDDDDGGVFGEGEGGDDDLVDEDSLLESSAPIKRNSEQDSESCATKRRACKDCSCGRAQDEEDGMPRTVVSVTDVDDVLVSSCGNCSKGDAFRCGGCPFLGKPAFEKGQERAIMLADLNAQQDD